MKSINPILLLFMFVACLIPTACSNLEYSPYAADIKGNKNIIEKNVRKIRERCTALPLRFAVVSDTHDYIDDLRDALDSISKLGYIDFVIHCGDLTDVGLPREFIWCRDCMDDCGIPYITVLGNHDCLGNGEDTYQYIFGKKNYSFTAAGVHFVCLNTNALEYDYSEPVPDLNFIEADADSADNENVTHTVVLMHSRPYDEQFNNNVAKAFRHYLNLYPGIREAEDSIPEGEYRGTRRRGFCVNGHNHSFQVSDIFDEGLLFFQADAIYRRSFLVFTITADGYEMERVCY